MGVNMLNEFLVTLNYPNSSETEQYRRVRTNIEYATIDQQIKTINFTSILANAAKSSTACNIAIMFTQKFNKILLIDADLRKPTVHRYLDMKIEKGLTDILLDYSQNNLNMEKVDLSNYIKQFKHKNLMNNLDVLLSGTKISNPSELIGSNTFKKLVKDLSSSYDLILIDSAPSAFITDGLVTSVAAGGTVFLTEYGQDKLESARETIKNLRTAGANIIGGLITKAPNKNEAYSSLSTILCKFCRKISERITDKIQFAL